MKPFQENSPQYFQKYINLVVEDNLIEALEKNLVEFRTFFSSIPSAKENYAYAQNKWTIKELVNHIIDTERIFAYRALRFARKDPQLLASYEEDVYAQNSADEVENRSLSSLIQEFELVRQSNIILFRSFSDTTLNNFGHIPAGKITVNSIGFVLCGHITHHITVAKEKYL